MIQLFAMRTMAGFVRYNMPANAPGTLTDRQAFDVAAFVLAHPRPVGGHLAVH